ncbi:hypothetical protein IWQ62_001097 [Dispira parvispora]|uniref:HMG box domain-containing protein n=1 Tax=Dispira parvispora TaxID=1520584 RepID=A0A9W8E8Y4_9FUNG|nr:hypothetical protein IWQ62_001097 [Dispira parvispora]
MLPRFLTIAARTLRGPTPTHNLCRQFPVARRYLTTNALPSSLSTRFQPSLVALGIQRGRLIGTQATGTQKRSKDKKPATKKKAAAPRKRKAKKAVQKKKPLNIRRRLVAVPKQGMSAFVAYIKEQFTQGRHQAHEGLAQATSSFAQEWAMLGQTQREKYEEIARQSKVEQAKALSQFFANTPLDLIAKENTRRRLLRKATGKRVTLLKHPDRPAQPRNPYIFFSRQFLKTDQGRALLQSKPLPEVSRELGSRWRNMGDAEKQVFVGQAQADKERYAAQMKEFLARHQ